MLRTGLAVAAAVAATAIAVSAAAGDHDGPRPLRPDAQWTTVFKPPPGTGIEGLTADRRGNLYTPGRVRRRAVPGVPGERRDEHDGRQRWRRRAIRPVWRSARTAGSTSPIPGGSWCCGRTPRPADAEVYATDVPGSNGVAWDRRGDLWVTDGGTAQGRVWRIGRDRVPVEMFRIQPTGQRRRRSRRSASAASAATTAGCRPGRSRSRRPAARRRTRSAPSTSSRTGSRSPSAATSSSPTPPAARSGASGSTTAAAC